MHSLQFLSIDDYELINRYDQNLPLDSYMGLGQRTQLLNM
jgi:hypothetical protein